LQGKAEAEANAWPESWKSEAGASIGQGFKKHTNIIIIIIIIMVFLRYTATYNWRRGVRRERGCGRISGSRRGTERGDSEREKKREGEREREGMVTQHTSRHT
jgi:hypothetical protein